MNTTATSRASMPALPVASNTKAAQVADRTAKPPIQPNSLAHLPRSGGRPFLDDRSASIKEAFVACCTRPAVPAEASKAAEGSRPCPVRKS